MLLTLFAAATVFSTVAFGGCGGTATLPEVNDVLQNTEQVCDGIALVSETLPIEEYDEYGVDATAEIVKKLTATLAPDCAADKRVDFSVAWVNASSTWATGKTVTDYVSITQATDGALTALLTCTQAFGEQIKVTASARSNPSAQATCTLDYAKRVSASSVHLAIGDFSVQSFSGIYERIKWSYSNSYAEGTYYADSIYTTALYSAYTVEDDFSNVVVTIKPTDAYKSAFSEKHELKNYFHNTTKCYLDAFGKDAVSNDYGFLAYGNTLPLIGITAVYDGNYDATEEEIAAWQSAAYAALKTLGEQPFLEITVTAEGQYSSFSQTKYVYADTSSLENVSL